MNIHELVQYPLYSLAIAASGLPLIRTPYHPNLEGHMETIMDLDSEVRCPPKNTISTVHTMWLSVFHRSAWISQT